MHITLIRYGTKSHQHRQIHCKASVLFMGHDVIATGFRIRTSHFTSELR